MSRTYQPAQGDIVWVDFDPARGREIKKRRPGLVVSTTAFNRVTQFCVICPITSTIRPYPTHFTLHQYVTQGQVVTSQLRSLDFRKEADRNVVFVEKLTKGDLIQVLDLVHYIF
ncbi:type II toxin-antitoxin system PemK/MazF family toxin [Listeria monocytogenes]|uniref:type II toxin-antitoxin system PemK/MazF family toxin n=1 Tax=Listeria monocytogenes TaxID=1639 RepID=UPI0011EAF106|nr:type II toxin-antitoxin system PemK/MazF family toxin [Listeria monocytogenes]TYV33109.1 type II toxin-antitoxin system PemK/MazF family toxin [Listeria monocytogenes]